MTHLIQILAEAARKWTFYDNFLTSRTFRLADVLREPR